MKKCISDLSNNPREGTIFIICLHKDFRVNDVQAAVSLSCTYSRSDYEPLNGKSSVKNDDEGE